MIPATWHGAGERERPTDGTALLSVGPRSPELSPSGDERHRPIPCQSCGVPTWNHSAKCWPCKEGWT